MQMLHGEVQPAEPYDHQSSEITDLKEALGIPLLDTDRDPLSGPQEEDGSELAALDEVSLDFSPFSDPNKSGQLWHRSRCYEFLALVAPEPLL